MFSNILPYVKTELISGAERYAGAHIYTAERDVLDNISIFIILFLVISVFIGVCVYEYKKEKRKKRY